MFAGKSKEQIVRMLSRVTIAVLLALAGYLHVLAQSQRVVARVVPLPDSVAEVFSPAAGRMVSPREKFYNVGDHIKKGDPIIIIEHRYNLHDAAHISNQRWDLLKVKLDTQY